MAAAIAGIDQRSLQVLANLVNTAGIGMPHDHNIAISIEHLADVRQRFALRDPRHLSVGD